MTTFLWILLGGLTMSAIALVGSVTLVLRASALEKLLLPLVAFGRLARRRAVFATGLGLLLALAGLEPG